MRSFSIPCLTLLTLTSSAILGCGGDQGTTETTSSGTSSSSSGGGAGGEGGTGGNGPTCSPEGPFDGPAIKPIDAPPGDWSWVGVDGAQCRDGSPTGFGVRPQTGSDKLIIYLEGGGACFNGTTCGINLGSFGSAAFTAWKASAGNTGIFNKDNAENPVKNWNMVYVPYCSGDIHAGNTKGVDIPGALSPKNQTFTGYANIYLYLKRIIPTFPNISKVLLTGISAGGFGAAYNYDRIAQAFCPTPVILLDDSGPPMADEYIAPCLQDRWRTLWGLNQTLPADCPNCATPNGGGIVNYVDFLGKKYPNARLSLISSTKDSVISLFFGYGKNTCKDIDGIATPVDGNVYSLGLADLRDNHMATPNLWATYYVDSTTHTYLLGPSFYTTTVNGTRLTNWVNDVVNDGPMNHIAP